MRIDRDHCDYGKAGAGVGRCFALDTASEVVIDDETLGPVLLDALLPIPPVGLMYKLLGPVLMDALLPIPLVIIGLSESY